MSALALSVLASGCFASHERPADAAVTDAGPIGVCACDECGCQADGCRFDDQVCDPFTRRCETVCDTAADCFPVLDQVCESNRCRTPPCRTDADCAALPGLTVACVEHDRRAVCTAVCVDDADCAALANGACSGGVCTVGRCRSDDECVARYDERWRCRPP